MRFNAFIFSVLIALTFLISSCGHHRYKDGHKGHSCSSCAHKADAGQCKAAADGKSCEKCAAKKCDKCSAAKCDCKNSGKCECGKDCKCPDCSSTLKKTSMNDGLHSSTVTKGQLADVDFHYRSRTFFTGAVNPAAIDAAQKEGVTVVIDLQTKGESKWDEKSAVQAKGMKYYNFPIEKTGTTYDKNTLAQIEKTFMEHHKKGEKVLIHCSTGLRAASWFAYHINVGHRDSVDKAITDAKAVGLNQQEDRIRNALTKTN